MLEKEELKKRIYNFLDQYQDGYDQFNYQYDYLEMAISAYLYRYYEEIYYKHDYRDTAFLQMFSAIGALNKEENPYYQMMKKIEEEYGLDRNIIEVSCGMFPALSYEIAKRQKELGKGTITGYDPELVTKTLTGTTLVDKKFTLSTPLPENSLIIGRKPCEATETIIRTANIKNIEFYIQVCSCNHTPIEYRLTHLPKPNQLLWHTYIEELAQDTLPKNFKIEKESTLLDSKDMIIKSKKMR